MFKHGLIASAKHWQLLKTHSDHPEQLIAESVALKVKIVSQDPTEKGLRKILNFGHTLGHALETYFLNTENPLLHGEAIAAGILLESFLSAHYGSLSNAELDDISSTLNSYYTLPQLSRETQEAVVLLMRHDKKNHKDAVNFVALAEIGEAKYDITYTDEALQEAFDYYNTLTYR